MTNHIPAPAEHSPRKITMIGKRDGRQTITVQEEKNPHASIQAPAEACVEVEQ